MLPGWIKNLKAMTFDVWNTLLVAKSYAKTRIEYLAKVLKRNGIFKGYEEMDAAYRLALEYTQRAITQGNYRHIPVAERLNYILEKLNCRLSESEKENLINDFATVGLNDSPPLVDGAEEVLALLKPRYQIGIICGSGLIPGRVLRTVLQNKGILRYFEALVFSDEVGYEKPHPIIFEKALAELKVRPEKTVHIGDLLDADVAGAKSLGLRAVWLNYDGKPNDTPYKPDLEIRRLLQLVEYFAPGTWKPKKFRHRY